MKDDIKTKQTGIGRRGFLGLCAAAGAGAMFGLRSFRGIEDAAAAVAKPAGEETWIPSICSMCVNRCGIRCRVV
ncbi:MAG: hypothetical protein OEY27_07800, partial [Gammaproteobacteria bacterium]|nr:hypothetical protein [Gammaproteobacteria bacterium]